MCARVCVMCSWCVHARVHARTCVCPHVTLLCLLLLHQKTRPFISPRINRLELLSILGTVLYVLCGIMLYPSIGPSSQGEICDEQSAEDFCGTLQPA